MKSGLDAKPLFLQVVMLSKHMRAQVWAAWPEQHSLAKLTMLNQIPWEKKAKVKQPTTKKF